MDAVLPSKGVIFARCLTLNTDLVKEIQKRINEATTRVGSLDPKVGRKLQEKLTLIERMAQIEKQVASGMGQG